METRLQILIIDDDQGITETMSDILDDAGFFVQIASSGEEGLDCLAKSSFDTVFIDVKMPGLSGVETLKRASLLYPEVKFVLMTAYVLDDIFASSFESDSYVFCYHPIEVEPILIELRNPEKQYEFAVVVYDNTLGIFEQLKGEDSLVVDGKSFIENTGLNLNHEKLLLFDPEMPMVNAVVVMSELTEKFPNRKSLILLRHTFVSEEEVFKDVNDTTIYSYLQKPVSIRFVLKLLSERARYLGKDLPEI